MEMEKGMKWQWEDSRPDGGGRGETLSICAWAGGTRANYPDFFENHQFHVIKIV